MKDHSMKSTISVDQFALELMRFRSLVSCEEYRRLEWMSLEKFILFQLIEALVAGRGRGGG